MIFSILKPKVNWILLKNRYELILGALLVACGIYFEASLPDAFTFVLLFSASLLELFRLSEDSHYKKKGVFIYIMSTVAYALMITTTSTAFYESLYSLALIWFIYTLTGYYLHHRESNSVAGLVQRLQQTLIGIGYIITIFFTIYITAYFLFSILGIDNEWSELFHLASATSAFAFLVVLLSFKENATYPVGTFYRILFGTIMPVLSLICGTLATIYLLQMILGYRPDAVFLGTYYPYIVVFFILYLFSFRCHISPKVKKAILFTFMILTVLALLFIIKRQITIPAQHVSAIYAVLCNSLFLAYTVYLYRHDYMVDKRLTQLIMAIIIIAQFPLIGYRSYTTHVTYSGQEPNWVAHFDLAALLSAEKDKTSLEKVKERHEKSPFTDYRFSGNLERSLQIDVTNYRHLGIHQELSLTAPELIMEEYRLSLATDGRTLSIAHKNVPLVSYDVQDLAQKWELTHENGLPLIIETDKYVLYILSYDISLQGDTVHFSSINFHWLIK